MILRLLVVISTDTDRHKKLVMLCKRPLDLACWYGIYLNERNRYIFGTDRALIVRTFEEVDRAQVRRPKIDRLCCLPYTGRSTASLRRSARQGGRPRPAEAASRFALLCRCSPPTPAAIELPALCSLLSTADCPERAIHCGGGAIALFFFLGGGEEGAVVSKL
jgi:hypothetical protein